MASPQSQQHNGHSGGGGGGGGLPQQTPIHTGAYSDTAMLTAEDFLQFASPEFTQGKVPYRPPPRHLC